ncbi:hypothetical protein QBC37DRAFT_319334 [Rhypophila decipiens]|uniref:Uncharacterized protein n=1 Tax=Rhypophila decipiens TaxID=261697 RepID=A0AAN6Y473_9PEZI|nr:hypothetical protein QBC37DRAFT_319334 [Rhypophila decipiens]
MDPASAIGLVSDGLALCSKVITELKKFAQAETHLKSLIQHVERVRQSTELLLVVIPEITKAGYGDLSLVLEPYAQQLGPLVKTILARAADIVAGQPKLGFARRLKWTLTSSATEDLVASLDGIEAQIRHQVDDAERRLANQPKIQDAFSVADTVLNAEAPPFDDEMKTVYHDISAERGTNQRKLRTWLGHNITTGHDSGYLLRREALSDAAYHGEWDEVFRIIELGQRQYGECWVNAARIRAPVTPYHTSLWTPLHQAVYVRAPIEVFERLIALGASRTLQSRWTEFTWRNMSALELAIELEVPWAVEILRPVIYQPVPPDTLRILQDKFHAIILRELEDKEFDRAWLHLPVLEVLTEYESGSTWFPLRFDAGRDSGYMFRLDSRHLLVWSINVFAPETSAKYKITEEDIFQVHEALIFPFSV